MDNNNNSRRCFHSSTPARREQKKTTADGDKDKDPNKPLGVAPGDVEEKHVDELFGPTEDNYSLARIKHNIVNYGLYGLAGTLLFYGATKSFLYVTNTFMQFTFTQIAWYGFVGGSFITLGTGSALLWFSKTLGIR